MAGVELATLPIGILWYINGSGVLAPAAGATAFIYQHVTPPAIPSVQIQVYQDEALTIPMTQPLLADPAGALPGYIDAPASGDIGQIFDVVPTFSGVTLNPQMGNALRGDTAMSGGGGGLLTDFYGVPANGLTSSAYWTFIPGSVITSGSSFCALDVTNQKIVFSTACVVMMSFELQYSWTNAVGMMEWSLNSSGFHSGDAAMSWSFQNYQVNAPSPTLSIPIVESAYWNTLPIVIAPGDYVEMSFYINVSSGSGEDAGSQCGIRRIG